MYVLAALALTTPPSLAVAYLWYVRSVTAFNIEEHNRAVVHACLMREQTEAQLSGAIDRIIELERRSNEQLEALAQNTQQISILADRR
jgi:hypothetical protein